MSGTIERILLAAAGGWNAPSARYRLGPLAESSRWQCSALSAPSLPQRERIEQLLEQADHSTVLILQRVMPRTADMHRLRRAFAAVLFDLDDAIYAVPPHDLTPLEAARRVARFAVRGSTQASRRRRPLIKTLGLVDAAIVGNEILGEFVGSYTARAVEIPTTVEPVPEPPGKRPSMPVIAWIGLPDNMVHLDLVLRPLERLRYECDFSLRIISSRPWAPAPIECEFVPWSEEASRAALLSSTVGIAPLIDTPWTRGKCAMRSIQYGGHALPTVASPVGITHRVVLHGRTGYLAKTQDDWVGYLRTLLAEAERAASLGEAALAHVRTHYSNALALARWSSVIESL